MTTYRWNDSVRDAHIKAITFDAVGTLIVPYPSVGEVYAEELSLLGYDLSSDLLEKNFIGAFRQFKQEQPEVILDQNSWRTIVANTLSGLTPGDDFDRQFSSLWNGFSKATRWRLLPGVEETLQNLHEQDGLRLFVLSNNDERLHRILNGLSIDSYFEAIFVSTELGAEKPARRVFERVQAQIKVAPENILHVGDKPIEDVQGALDAGWNAALVSSDTELTCNVPSVMQANSIRHLFSGLL